MVHAMVKAQENRMPRSHSHQGMLELIGWLLRTYVGLFEMGLLRMTPFEVKLTPSGASREFDLFFLCNANKDRLTEDRLVGAPDLAVEIISKGSIKRDRDDKFREYAEAGV